MSLRLMFLTFCQSASMELLFYGCLTNMLRVRGGTRQDVPTNVIMGTAPSVPGGQVDFQISTCRIVKRSIELPPTSVTRRERFSGGRASGRPPRSGRHSP